MHYSDAYIILSKIMQYLHALSALLMHPCTFKSSLTTSTRYVHIQDSILASAPTHLQLVS